MTEFHPEKLLLNFTPDLKFRRFPHSVLLPSLLCLLRRSTQSPRFLRHKI